MSKLDPNAEPVAPKDAATLVVLRSGTDSDEPEVFCVRRHARSAFMGGALVFPGGKLDADDGLGPLRERSDGTHPRATVFADHGDHAAALCACACRESFEEAAILPCDPAIDAATVLAARERFERGEARLHELLVEAGTRLATRSLAPFARWITPVGEQRRYDARFFMTRLPVGQEGLHDAREATSSVWAPASRILRVFHDGDLWLAPPTIRCLELLAPTRSVEEAIALCAAQSLAPICPLFVPGEPPMLVLPGDPRHQVAERRVAGATRFELRGDRFVSASDD